MKRGIINAADLFCGAGGFSLGLALAARRLGYSVRFKGVNHDADAIATWKANHPDGEALHTGVDDIDPRSLYQFGDLFALLASPACTHHSRARGGVPMNDQSRNTAWCVTRWAESLQPNLIYVENVPEFMDWGPLGCDGRPLKSQKGRTFKAWLGTLEGLGYKVEHRVFNAADYGPATTRSRLYIQAVRGRRQVRWPRRTHAPLKEITRHNEELKNSLFTASDFDELKPWTPARSIIDWTIKGRWLDEMPGKKKYGGLPLSPKTLARIHAGLRRYGLKGLSACIIPHFGERDGQAPRVHSVEDPLPTVTGQGAGSLLDAYVVPIDHTGGGKIAVDSIDSPLRTVTTEARHGLIEPLIVTLRGTSQSHIESSASSVEEPLRTISTTGTHHNLLHPFLVEQRGTSDAQIEKHSAKSLDSPLPTVTGGVHHSLIEGELVPDAFLVEVAHGDGCGRGNSGREKSLDNPLGSLPCSNRFAIVEADAFLVPTAHGDGHERCNSVDDPLKTICGNRDGTAVIVPHLLGQQSGAALRPVTEPTPTISTAGAIALIEGVVEGDVAFLTKFYGTGTAVSLSDPLDTITTKDRFGLVMLEAPKFDVPMTPDAILDWTMPRIIIDGRQARIRLRWRMLQPGELAAGMSFPKWYKFPKGKTKAVKQIGNAVCPEFIDALISCQLS